MWFDVGEEAGSVGLVWDGGDLNLPAGVMPQRNHLAKVDMGMANQHNINGVTKIGKT